MAGAEALKKPAVRPEKAPPTDRKPSALVTALMTRGRPPHRVVKFPRVNEDGQLFLDVMVRALTVEEQELALARARTNVARLVRGSEGYEHRPEDLEYNERSVEILVVALRDPANPQYPFFAMGNEDDTESLRSTPDSERLRKECTTEEIAQLMRAYADVLSSVYPNLRDMNDAEFEAWVEVVAKGFVDRPFSLLPHELLETLCERAVSALVSLRASGTGTPSTSYSSSD